MFTQRIRRWRRAAIVLTAALTWTVTLGAEARDSQRLGRAKDLIYDEQWSRAIEELRAAAADPREPNKDEALFWLAHSQNQAGDPAAAIESIQRLERAYPQSRWVKPARSLRIEIAQRLRREDVLWLTAVPPAPPVMPSPPPTPVASTPSAMETPPPRIPAPPALPSPPGAVAAPVPRAVATPPPPMPAAAPAVWLPQGYIPDADLRIQALSSLIRTDAVKVIPILKEIALESHNAHQARSAVFVLAQSGRSDARETVVQVAKSGPDLVRIAAVRELGRFGGPDTSKDLLQVYTTSSDLVKRQVVRSLGERADVSALQRIAQSESNAHLRDIAIVTLGTAGGGDQLGLLYARVPRIAKRSVIVGLFNARAEDELIRVAEQERDESLRREALMRLRLLGTPKAKAYLERVSRK
jgi:HEAT repeat protein